MRRVEGRGDGAVGDPESLADGRVVEVGVVAQEDGRPLPLGKARERDAQLCMLLGPAVRGRRLVVGDGAGSCGGRPTAQR